MSFFSLAHPVLSEQKYHNILYIYASSNVKGIQIYIHTNHNRKYSYIHANVKHRKLTK